MPLSAEIFKSGTSFSQFAANIENFQLYLNSILSVAEVLTLIKTFLSPLRVTNIVELSVLGLVLVLLFTCIFCVSSTCICILYSICISNCICVILTLELNNIASLCLLPNKQLCLIGEHQQIFHLILLLSLLQPLFPFSKNIMNFIEIITISI